MKLEEAKEIIENEIGGCDVFSCEMCKRDCTCDNSPCVEEGCQLAIAVDTVFQELEHLQKESEELKEIDLTTVYIKGVYDEKDRWRNKIREIINNKIKGLRHLGYIENILECEFARLRDELLKEE